MFAGILHSREAPAGAAARKLAATLLAALTPGHPPDAAGTHTLGTLLLVQAKQCQSRAEAERWRERPLPQRHRTSGRLIGFWGRLDNRSELATRLELGPDEPDEQFVLAAFDRWGPDAASQLEGDLAAAVVDPERRSVWLVRDRMGVKPLYWWVTAAGVHFATSAAVLRALRPAAENADPAWIARELSDVHHAEDATPWTDVHRVAPGHWVQLSADGRATVRRYHEFRDDPPWATVREDRWVAAYREVLEEVIRCRMRGVDGFAAESSGGIDSSTVIGYLARFLGEDEGRRIFAVGYAQAPLEGEYIYETSRAARLETTVLLRHGRDDTTIERTLAAVGFPHAGTGASYGALHSECQRRGLRTLFSGFGGDESVTNSGFLLRRELIDHGDYRTLYSVLGGSPVGRVARYAKARLYGRRYGGGHRKLEHAMARRWPHVLVRDGIARELGLADEYRVSSTFDAPYRRINDFVLKNRLRSNISGRLESCTLIAATYGLDYRWPLLDPRLTQQYLSTPSIEKGGRQTRLLHRRAADGVVAPKVLWKPTKDMGPVDAAKVLKEASTMFAEGARADRERLHPTLAEVIDIPRLDRQLAATSRGSDTSQDFNLQVSRNMSHLRWLNRWLDP